LTTYEITLNFTTEQLGTAPSDPDIYKTFIATKKLKDAKKAATDKNQTEILAKLETDEKALSEEEVALLPNDDKGITVFRRNDTGLILLDHMIRGFLKEAASAISGVWGATSKIDKWCFVKERIIPITRDGVQVKEQDGTLQRPLRAQTAMGPRVTLAASELVNAGAEVKFHLVVLPLGENDKKMPIDEKLVRSWFEYGQFQGISQWRNGSYGRFTADIRKV
jgi:hypothetical protein